MTCSPASRSTTPWWRQAGTSCSPPSRPRTKALYDGLDGAAPQERVPKQKVAGTRLTYRYRWFNQVPPRDGEDARLVDGVCVTITDTKGKVTYQNAFVTSLDIARDSVAEIVACARARWKIENEGFNVLESNGYHLEHDFGHGKQSLAMTSAALNMLAFAVHTLCHGLEQIRVEARTAKRARHRFVEHIRTITAYLVCPDWNTLVQTLIGSIPPPEIEAQIGR